MEAPAGKPMTTEGERQHNSRGRSGKIKTSRRTKIMGQFSPRPIEMMESPAYRALSLSAHRIISRIEIELAHHGGQDNGRLPVTFEHFNEYGIDRHAIAPAIRECEALGFVVITERGRSGNGEFRRPNLFRLTFRATRVEEPTDEWRAIETVEQAAAIARVSRKSVAKNSENQ
jgi:hypothetical protein